MIRSTCAATVALLGAAAAQAHPGHALSSPADLLHHLADPGLWPLAVALGIVGVAAIGLRWRGRGQDEQPGAQAGARHADRHPGRR